MRFSIPVPKQHIQAPLRIRIIHRIGLGLIGLMAVCTVQAIYIVQTPLTEPAPLLGASAIATRNIEGQEQILIFSQALNRVQIFDANGTFQSSIATPQLKTTLGLCGGGDHPILLTTAYSWQYYFELRQGTFIPIQDQALPEFCQTSKLQTSILGQQHRYTLRDWPQRVTVRPIGQPGEHVLIPGNWWITFSGSLPFVLGYGIAAVSLIVLGQLMLYTRNPTQP